MSLRQPNLWRASHWLIVLRSLRAIVTAMSISALSASITSAQDTYSMTPKSQELLIAIEAAKIHHESSDVWKPENGPWAAYLKKSFKEGLSQSERALYEEVLNAGDCETVKSLQLAGFLLLNPSLRAAHARNFTSEIFVKTVVEKSVEFDLCRNRSGIFSALRDIEAKKLEHLLPLHIGGESEKAIHVLSENEKGHQAFSRLCWSAAGLVRMAINDEYRPAVEDVLKYLERPKLFTLPPQQAYYFYHRAKQLGVIDELPSDGRLDVAYHAIPAKKRMQIERYLREREDFKPVSGGWGC